MRCVYALLVLLALNGCASEKRQTFVPINPAVNRTDGERDTALQSRLELVSRRKPKSHLPQWHSGDSSEQHSGERNNQPKSG